MMYEDYQEYFANRLSQLRMKKGVSAMKTSLDMGQSKGYITQIERKHNVLSMMVFFYICEYLNISPKDFFDNDVEVPELFGELLSNIKKLDEEQLSNINSIVKGLVKQKG